MPRQNQVRGGAICFSQATPGPGAAALRVFGGPQVQRCTPSHQRVAQKLESRTNEGVRGACWDAGPAPPSHPWSRRVVPSGHPAGSRSLLGEPSGGWGIGARDAHLQAKLHNIPLVRLQPFAACYCFAWVEQFRAAGLRTPTTWLRHGKAS